MYSLEIIEIQKKLILFDFNLALLMGYAQSKKMHAAKKSESDNRIKELEKQIVDLEIVYKDLLKQADIEPSSFSIFYYHADGEDSYVEMIDRHFIVIKRLYNVSTWYKGSLYPGEDIMSTLSHKLIASDFIFFIVTINLLNSGDFFSNLETLKKRKEKGRLFAIIADFCNWDLIGFNGIIILPKNREPLTSKKWSNINQPISLITREITIQIKEILNSNHTNLKR